MLNSNLKYVIAYESLNKIVVKKVMTRVVKFRKVRLDE